MKELAKLYLLSKVIGEAVSLIGILLCAGTVAWLVFHVLPSAIERVFAF